MKRACKRLHPAGRARWAVRAASSRCRCVDGIRRRGFALTELLVAMLLSVLLAGAVLAVVSPSSAAFRRQPAISDLHQRVRAAAEVVTARLLSACSSGPPGPRSLLGVEVPCLLPYGVGTHRVRTPGDWHPATLSILTGLPGTVPSVLASPLLPGASVAELAATGCPAADRSCGIREGHSLLLAGPGGRSELVRVALVSGPSLAIQRPGPAAGGSFPAGAAVMPVDPVVFYLGPATATDPPQLRRDTTGGSDLPLLDHVVAMRVRLFGEASPPVIREIATLPALTSSYGPLPPPAGVDDPLDSWGAGENCIFTRVDGASQPRLPSIGANPLGLVELSPAVLSDGPWCPDAASPARFDADLLRVRRVRVSLRLEVGQADLRGQQDRFFLRPGTSTSGLAFVPDQEIAFDVVPRAAGGGR
ncbi:MAG TPA: prepilin-type N-terminal cleavage/methylation domain-containing protein [Vicinamibacterales bacterium]|nr:prepilin-type N-terminal cleavage/methylation domain-containing protein [Vicinamibacterales bacterium]